MLVDTLKAYLTPFVINEIRNLYSKDEHALVGNDMVEIRTLFSLDGSEIIFNAGLLGG